MTGTELAAYEAAPIEQYRPGLAMTPEQAKALDDQVRACTKAVLREGTDYGAIPGTGEDRKVLLKPGAEKLLQWFGFGFRLGDAEIERDDDGRKQGVTYRCTITKRIGHPERGLLVDVVSCEGYAGYDEPKFYKSAEQAQADAEAKERYWAAKDKRPANPNKWKHVGEYRAPWNTIIKMAQKRAIVGAAIDATAAAGLFSQDEDSGPAAGDGSGWYEQALEQANTFTNAQDADQLLAEAEQADRDGLCTRGQAQLIANRIKTRARLLKDANPADAEDLGRQEAASWPAKHGGRAAPRGQRKTPAAAAPDGPAAGPDQQQASGPAAAAGPGLPPLPGEDEPGDQAAAPGKDRHAKLVGACQGQFKRLDYTEADREERLQDAAKLTGREYLASLAQLTDAELSTLADTLAKCRDRAALDALLEAGERTEP